MLDVPTLEDTSSICVTVNGPYPPLRQFQSFMGRPYIILTPLPVSITSSGVILPSSSATMIEAVLKVEPGSSISLMALFLIS